MSYRREDYQGYCAVNRRFAAALASILKPDDLIWVHDYHLIPLALELRRLWCRTGSDFSCTSRSFRTKCWTCCHARGSC